jgi:hypothetical protein
MIKTILVEESIYCCDVCKKEKDQREGWMSCDGCHKFVCPEHNKGFIDFDPNNWKSHIHLQHLMATSIYHVYLCPDCLISKDERKHQLTEAIKNLQNIDKQLKPIYEEANKYSKILADLRDKK